MEVRMPKNGKTGVSVDTCPILWFESKPYYRNRTYTLRCTESMVDKLLSHKSTIWKSYEVIKRRVVGKRFTRFYRFQVIGNSLPLFFEWCRAGISPDFD